MIPLLKFVCFWVSAWGTLASPPAQPKDDFHQLPDYTPLKVRYIKFSTEFYAGYTPEDLLLHTKGAFLNSTEVAALQKIFNRKHPKGHFGWSVARVYLTEGDPQRPSGILMMDRDGNCLWLRKMVCERLSKKELLEIGEIVVPAYERNPPETPPADK